ncbi:E3 ubiquitin-protein ligase LRSAM1 [Diachasma alloeum]|uniref:E3 ubiquitin-protein ligase LRSAM1 n=1 Tax=Diachasma alloeum TaxID=454923 RepID=UPI0007381F01|nr:E3 ubiquitin-protein ligase LRSAM1 [Diachasma alloeum]
MENLTQSLLSNYYGLGGERREGKAVASHEGFRRELGEEGAVDGDVSGNFHREDTSGGGPSSETQIVDSNETNGAVNGVVHPWRAFAEVDLNDEIVDDEEVDLEVGNSQIEMPEEGRSGFPKLIIPDKDVRDEAAELGVADDVVLDSASDVSTMSTKKKTRKKSRLSATGPSDPQPLILMPPVPKRNPIINKEFCDMTNASIIEFPSNLLEELSTIRMLYLENNSLNELPEQLFTSLSFLQWLDVRNNWLKTLPPTIKHHQCLETILLQGNRIEKLPLELCLVPNLKTLHTAGNPLTSPPPEIIAQGLASTMNFLRKEWNMEYPNDPVTPPQEVKSASTILCDDPPVLTSSRSSGLLNRSSMSALSKSLKTLSTREKSRNYRPSNRCRSSGGDSTLEEKIRWISKVREILIKQAAEIQRTKDREILREWREDRRSFEKSMKKAASRTQEGIPYDIDCSDTPFLTIKKLQKPPNPSNRRNIKLSGDMDKKMFEIIESLQHYQSKNKSASLNADLQLELLHSEIIRIETLYEEIQALKRQNNASYRKYNGPPISSNSKRYDPPPSIIV